MLHRTIRNDDFWRNTALQHCCDIVSKGYNIVPALQRCVALNNVVAGIVPYNITLTERSLEILEGLLKVFFIDTTVA